MTEYCSFYNKSYQHYLRTFQKLLTLINNIFAINGKVYFCFLRFFCFENNKNIIKKQDKNIRLLPIKKIKKDELTTLSEKSEIYVNFVFLKNIYSLPYNTGNLYLKLMSEYIYKRSSYNTKDHKSSHNSCHNFYACLFILHFYILTIYFLLPS